MLKIDKIKIVSNIQNKSNINEDKFTTIIKDGCIIEKKFTSLSPYLLYIEADLREQELVIEFTSKILGDNYPQSINITNIRECLSTINTLGLCDLDIDSKEFSITPTPYPGLMYQEILSKSRVQERTVVLGNPDEGINISY